MMSSREFRPLLFFLLVVVAFMSCKDSPDTAATTQPAEPVLEHEVIDPTIEAYMQRMVAEDHFTGVALAAHGGDIIHAAGYGRATEDSDNHVSTAFHVASITKQFTAAAVLQLIEKGIVSLDSSVNTYLPETYRSPKWDDLTLHHLLSHTGGLPDYAVVRDYYDVVDGFCLGDTVDGMVREAMAKDLEFVPGSAWAYSNLGYTLLGLVIREQTQTPYDQYLKENVLEPMGMHSSRIHVIGHVPADNEAAGHRWDEATSAHVHDDVVSLPVTEPDGGLVTTLADFLKWTRIYLGEEQTILTDQSIALMTTPVRVTHLTRPQGGPISYGYGLLVAGELVGHSGYIVGFTSHFELHREKELLVVVFSNSTSNDTVGIAQRILEIMDEGLSAIDSPASS
jgi:CubicO group peptidase (beta-lactamase class C family)